MESWKASGTGHRPADNRAKRSVINHSEKNAVAASSLSSASHPTTVMAPGISVATSSLTEQINLASVWEQRSLVSSWISEIANEAEQLHVLPTAARHTTQLTPLASSPNALPARDESTVGIKISTSGNMPSINVRGPSTIESGTAVERTPQRRSLSGVLLAPLQNATTPPVIFGGNRAVPQRSVSLTSAAEARHSNAKGSQPKQKAISNENNGAEAKSSGSLSVSALQRMVDKLVAMDVAMHGKVAEEARIDGSVMGDVKKVLNGPSPSRLCTAGLFAAAEHLSYILDRSHESRVPCNGLEGPLIRSIIRELTKCVFVTCSPDTSDSKTETEDRRTETGESRRVVVTAQNLARLGLVPAEAATLQKYLMGELGEDSTSITARTTRKSSTLGAEGDEKEKTSLSVKMELATEQLAKVTELLRQKERAMVALSRVQRIGQRVAKSTWDRTARIGTLRMAFVAWRGVSRRQETVAAAARAFVTRITQRDVQQTHFYAWRLAAKTEIFCRKERQMQQVLRGVQDEEATANNAATDATDKIEELTMVTARLKEEKYHLLNVEKKAMIDQIESSCAYGNTWRAIARDMLSFVRDMTTVEGLESGIENLRLVAPDDVVMNTVEVGRRKPGSGQVKGDGRAPHRWEAGEEEKKHAAKNSASLSLWPAATVLFGGGPVSKGALYRQLAISAAALSTATGGGGEGRALNAKPVPFVSKASRVPIPAAAELALKTILPWTVGQVKKALQSVIQNGQTQKNGNTAPRDDITGRHSLNQNTAASKKQLSYSPYKPDRFGIDRNTSEPLWCADCCQNEMRILQIIKQNRIRCNNFGGDLKDGRTYLLLLFSLLNERSVGSDRSSEEREVLRHSSTDSSGSSDTDSDDHHDFLPAAATATRKRNKKAHVLEIDEECLSLFLRRRCVNCNHNQLGISMLSLLDDHYCVYGTFQSPGQSNAMADARNFGVASTDKVAGQNSLLRPLLPLTLTELGKTSSTSPQSAPQGTSQAAQQPLSLASIANKKRMVEVLRLMGLLRLRIPLFASPNQSDTNTTPPHEPFISTSMRLLATERADFHQNILNAVHPSTGNHGKTTAKTLPYSATISAVENALGAATSVAAGVILEHQASLFRQEEADNAFGNHTYSSEGMLAEVGEEESEAKLHEHERAAAGLARVRSTMSVNSRATTASTRASPIGKGQPASSRTISENSSGAKKSPTNILFGSGGNALTPAEVVNAVLSVAESSNNSEYITVEELLMGSTDFGFLFLYTLWSHYAAPKVPEVLLPTPLGAGSFSPQSAAYSAASATSKIIRNSIRSSSNRSATTRTQTPQHVPTSHEIRLTQSAFASYVTSYRGWLQSKAVLQHYALYVACSKYRSDKHLWVGNADYSPFTSAAAVSAAAIFSAPPALPPLQQDEIIAAVNARKTQTGRFENERSIASKNAAYSGSLAGARDAVMRPRSVSQSSAVNQPDAIPFNNVFASNSSFVGSPIGGGSKSLYGLTDNNNNNNNNNINLSFGGRLESSHRYGSMASMKSTSHLPNNDNVTGAVDAVSVFGGSSRAASPSPSAFGGQSRLRNAGVGAMVSSPPTDSIHVPLNKILQLAAERGLKLINASGSSCTLSSSAGAIDLAHAVSSLIPYAVAKNIPHLALQHFITAHKNALSSSASNLGNNGWIRKHLPLTNSNAAHSTSASPTAFCNALESDADVFDRAILPFLIGGGTSQMSQSKTAAQKQRSVDPASVIIFASLGLGDHIRALLTTEIRAQQPLAKLITARAEKTSESDVAMTRDTEGATMPFAPRSASLRARHDYYSYLMLQQRETDPNGFAWASAISNALVTNAYGRYVRCQDQNHLCNRSFELAREVVSRAVICTSSTVGETNNTKANAPSVRRTSHSRASYQNAKGESSPGFSRPALLNAVGSAANGRNRSQSTSVSVGTVEALRQQEISSSSLIRVASQCGNPETLRQLAVNSIPSLGAIGRLGIMINDLEINSISNNQISSDLKVKSSISTTTGQVIREKLLEARSALEKQTRVKSLALSKSSEKHFSRDVIDALSARNAVLHGLLSKSRQRRSGDQKRHLNVSKNLSRQEAMPLLAEVKRWIAAEVSDYLHFEAYEYTLLNKNKSSSPPVRGVADLMFARKAGTNEVIRVKQPGADQATLTAPQTADGHFVRVNLKTSLLLTSLGSQINRNEVENSERDTSVNGPASINCTTPSTADSSFADYHSARHHLLNNTLLREGNLSAITDHYTCGQAADGEPKVTRRFDYKPPTLRDLMKDHVQMEMSETDRQRKLKKEKLRERRSRKIMSSTNNTEQTPYNVAQATVNANDGVRQGALCPPAEENPTAGRRIPVIPDEAVTGVANRLMVASLQHSINVFQLSALPAFCDTLHDIFDKYASATSGKNVLVEAVISGATALRNENVDYADLIIKSCKMTSDGDAKEAKRSANGHKYEEGREPSVGGDAENEVLIEKSARGVSFAHPSRDPAVVVSATSRSKSKAGKPAKDPKDDPERDRSLGPSSYDNVRSAAGRFFLRTATNTQSLFEAAFGSTFDRAMTNGETVGGDGLCMPLLPWIDPSSVSREQSVISGVPNAALSGGSIGKSTYFLGPGNPSVLSPILRSAASKLLLEDCEGSSSSSSHKNVGGNTSRGNNSANPREKSVAQTVDTAVNVLARALAEECLIPAKLFFQKEQRKQRPEAMLPTNTSEGASPNFASFGDFIHNSAQVSTAPRTFQKNNERGGELLVESSTEGDAFLTSTFKHAVDQLLSPPGRSHSQFTAINEAVANVFDFSGTPQSQGVSFWDILAFTPSIGLTFSDFHRLCSDAGIVETKVTDRECNECFENEGTRQLETHELWVIFSTACSKEIESAVLAGAGPHEHAQNDSFGSFPSSNTARKVNNDAYETDASSNVEIQISVTQETPRRPVKRQVNATASYPIKKGQSSERLTQMTLQYASHFFSALSESENGTHLGAADAQTHLGSNVPKALAMTFLRIGRQGLIGALIAVALARHGPALRPTTITLAKRHLSDIGERRLRKEKQVHYLIRRAYRYEQKVRSQFNKKVFEIETKAALDVELKRRQDKSSAFAANVSQKMTNTLATPSNQNKTLSDPTQNSNSPLQLSFSLRSPNTTASQMTLQLGIVQNPSAFQGHSLEGTLCDTKLFSSSENDSSADDLLVDSDVKKLLSLSSEKGTKSDVSEDQNRTSASRALNNFGFFSHLDSLDTYLYHSSTSSGEERSEGDDSFSTASDSDHLDGKASVLHSRQNDGFHAYGLESAANSFSYEDRDQDYEGDTDQRLFGGVRKPILNRSGLLHAPSLVTDAFSLLVARDLSRIDHARITSHTMIDSHTALAGALKLAVERAAEVALMEEQAIEMQSGVYAHHQSSHTESTMVHSIPTAVSNKMAHASLMALSVMNNRYFTLELNDFACKAFWYQTSLSADLHRYRSVSTLQQSSSLLLEDKKNSMSSSALSLSRSLPYIIVPKVTLASAVRSLQDIGERLAAHVNVNSKQAKPKRGGGNTARGVSGPSPRFTAGGGKTTARSQSTIRGENTLSSSTTPFEITNSGTTVGGVNALGIKKPPSKPPASLTFPISARMYLQTAIVLPAVMAPLIKGNGAPNCNTSSGCAQRVSVDSPALFHFAHFIIALHRCGIGVDDDIGSGTLSCGEAQSLTSKSNSQQLVNEDQQRCLSNYYWTSLPLSLVAAVFLACSNSQKVIQSIADAVLLRARKTHEILELIRKEKRQEEERVQKRATKLLNRGGKTLKSTINNESDDSDYELTEGPKPPPASTARPNEAQDLDSGSPPQTASIRASDLRALPDSISVALRSCAQAGPAGDTAASQDFDNPTSLVLSSLPPVLSASPLLCGTIGYCAFGCSDCGQKRIITSVSASCMCGQAAQQRCSCNFGESPQTKIIIASFHSMSVCITHSEFETALAMLASMPQVVCALSSSISSNETSAQSSSAYTFQDPFQIGLGSAASQLFSLQPLVVRVTWLVHRIHKHCETQRAREDLSAVIVQKRQSHGAVE